MAESDFSRLLAGDVERPVLSREAVGQAVRLLAQPHTYKKVYPDKVDPENGTLSLIVDHGLYDSMGGEPSKVTVTVLPEGKIKAAFQFQQWGAYDGTDTKNSSVEIIINALGNVSELPRDKGKGRAVALEVRDYIQRRLGLDRAADLGSGLKDAFGRHCEGARTAALAMAQIVAKKMPLTDPVKMAEALVPDSGLGEEMRKESATIMAKGNPEFERLMRGSLKL